MDSKQRRLTSLIESISSTLVGLVVATLLQLVVLPYYGVTNLTMHDNVEIAVIFMLVGMVRGYLFRRAFEWLRVSGILR